MSNNLCIDPAWREYYNTLELPISQEPERCEAADGFDPHVAATCIPQSNLAAFRPNPLWQPIGEETDIDPAWSIALTLPLLPLWSLAQALRKIHPSSKAMDKAARASDAIVRGDFKSEPKLADQRNAKTLESHAQGLAALLVNPLLPASARQALRPLTIQLFLHGAHYYGEVGDYQAALKLLDRAAELLSRDERLFADPQLRGIPPMNDSDVGGLIRERGLAIAKDYAGTTLEPPSDLYPRLVYPTEDRLDVYFDPILHRLQWIEAQVRLDRVPSSAYDSILHFFELAHYYRQALVENVGYHGHVLTNTEYYQDRSYLNYLQHYVAFRQAKEAYGRNPQQAHHDAMMTAAARFFKAVGNLRFEIVHHWWVEEVARAYLPFLGTGKDADALVEALADRFPQVLRGLRPAVQIPTAVLARVPLSQYTEGQIRLLLHEHGHDEVAARFCDAPRDRMTLERVEAELRKFSPTTIAAVDGWYARRGLERGADDRALLLVELLLRFPETPSDQDIAEIALRQEWGPTELRFADMDPEKITANRRLYQTESPWTLRGGQNHSGFNPRSR